MDDTDQVAPEATRFELGESRVEVEPIDPSLLLTWLGARRQPPVVSWPVVLFPDFLAGRGTMPPDSVELYQRVDWSAPLPEGDFEATVRPGWVAGRGDRTEYELVSEAAVDGRVVATSRIVCLTRADIEPAGERDLPAPPDPGAFTQVRHVTVSDDDVTEYCDATRTHYLVTSRMTVARELGFRNILVPGPLLTVLHLAAWTEIPAAGTVEVWFRGPVTAGSAMTLQRAAGGEPIWCLRPVGAARPATVSRAGGPGH